MTVFDPEHQKMLKMLEVLDLRKIARFLESNPSFFEGLNMEEYIEAMDSMIAKLGIQLPAIGDDDETIDQEIDNYHEAWGEVSEMTKELRGV